MSIVEHLLARAAQELESATTRRRLARIMSGDEAWLEQAILEAVDAFDAERKCISCGIGLPEPEGPGRPPVRCEACRAARDRPRLCVQCGADITGAPGRQRRCDPCRGLPDNRINGEKQPRAARPPAGEDNRAALEPPRLPWQ